MDFAKFDALAIDGCPLGAGEFLHDKGLPRKVITIFEAAPKVDTRSALLDGHKIVGIVLGLSREKDEIFLDFESGRVWLLASWGSGQPSLVNKSLPAFAESLILVDSLYPCYPAGRDLDDAERAEGEVRDALEAIDDASTADPDGFWSAFLDDVANGDYV